MNDPSFPVYNENGDFFCRAKMSEDGHDVILIGKRCNISFHCLQMSVIKPKKYSLRSRKKITDGKGAITGK